MNYASPDLNESVILEQKYVLDTTMVKSIDLSDLQENEIVKYHLKVTDWTELVEWEFFILFGTDTLLHKYSNEASIDTFFHDYLYVGDCEGYLDCKKKWYKNDLYIFEVEKISPSDSRIPLLKNVSKFFAEEKHENYGTSKEEAINNYNYLWEYYSDKDMKAIYFNFAPEGRSTPILVFHPRLDKLVPIYSP